MTQTLQQQARESAQAGRFLLVSLFLGAAVACMAPRATNILLPLAALTCLWSARNSVADRHERPVGSLFRDPLFIASGLLAAYLFLSAAFAIEKPASMKQALVVVLVLALAWAGSASAARLAPELARRGALALALGVGAASLFLSIELLSDQVIARFVHNLTPLLRPGSNKDFILQDGRIIGIQLFELNRNLALYALFAWPAIHVARTLLAPPARIALLAAIAVTAALALALSVHETSKIAMLAAAAVFGLSLLSAQWLRRLLIAAWCAGFLLAVPLASYLYHSAHLHTAPWLPTSAQARIIIWGYSAEKIAEKPLFGIGIRSTRFLDRQLAASAEWPADHVYPRRLGHHSHNIFIQSWLELGLVGVMLVMAAGALLLARLAALPARFQPAANATAAAFLVIASFAWGMWQSWLVAGYGLAVILLCVTARAGTPSRAGA